MLGILLRKSVWGGSGYRGQKVEDDCVSGEVAGGKATSWRKMAVIEADQDKF
jgi:hypothetical protein